MLLNVLKSLKQFDGSPVMDNDGHGNLVEATIRAALVNALLAPSEKDTGVEKVTKYDLAMRIYKNDEVELEAKEASLIQELVGKLFAPLIVGQLSKLLDGTNS